MTQNVRLAAIDRHTVAARMAVEGRPARVLHGHGLYEDDAELGPVLRILIDDPAGDFELILLENQWNGSIESGEALGCDFLVHL